MMIDDSENIHNFPFHVKYKDYRFTLHWTNNLDVEFL